MLTFEVYNAVAMGRNDFISRLIERERQLVGKAADADEAGDHRAALKHALAYREQAQFREQVENADKLDVVLAHEDAFQAFLTHLRNDVDRLILSEIYKNLFGLAFYPWECDTEMVETWLRRIDEIISDLVTHFEQRPEVWSYIDYLRAVQNEAREMMAKAKNN